MAAEVDTLAEEGTGVSIVADELDDTSDEEGAEMSIVAEEVDDDTLDVVADCVNIGGKRANDFCNTSIQQRGAYDSLAILIRSHTSTGISLMISSSR